MKDSENAQKQLVAYHRAVVGADEIDSFQNRYRVSPPIADFTIQCAFCSQWRTLPMEKYVEIRERILELPFVCKEAREWRPDISCQVQSDIVQDESRLWAMDKPNIPQPPLGWERILKIRAAGGTKFADVFYVKSSLSKKFRSMNEVEKYFQEHPNEMAVGIMSQFSFETPRPLQKNYVKKCAPSVSHDRNATRMPKNNEPIEVAPLAYANPVENAALQPYGPGQSAPSSKVLRSKRSSQAAKKARKGGISS